MNTLFSFVFGVIFILLPFPIQAVHVEAFHSDSQQVEVSDPLEEPLKEMTQEQIDDLLGLDPYLGPTSWLGSKKN